MMKNKKNQQKKPPFNQYWIFGSVIIAFIILNLFSGSGSEKSNITTPSKFFNFVKDGDVDKIEIVNKREVYVFLTNDALLKDVHRNSSGKSILSIAKLTPNYTFEFGDLQNFENKLSATSREFNQDIEVNYVTKQNIWGDILISMLPFILIIAIWIFIMRRMSSGTGGAGGQIFNIGKSKAKLFDANAKVKVTFQDVAGLEGAKEEVQEIVDFLKNPIKNVTI